MKVIYDRGNPKQVLDNHQSVTQKEYTADAVKLPAPEEIPNVDLQVVNYHRPLLGTFHAKYAIIDRKIALIGSHNIQVHATFREVGGIFISFIGIGQLGNVLPS